MLENKVKLELLHDLDMLNMIEKMKRGGLCFVGIKRYAKAKSQHMPYYDPNTPSNYIIYEDANNFYGCSMSEYLPHKDFQFNNYIDFDTILNTLDDSETGYILEVDLHFPEELHYKFKEFPPALETLTLAIDWLTPYQRKIGDNTGIIHS